MEHGSPRYSLNRRNPALIREYQHNRQYRATSEMISSNCSFTEAHQVAPVVSMLTLVYTPCFCLIPIWLVSNIPYHFIMMIWLPRPSNFDWQKKSQGCAGCCWFMFCVHRSRYSYSAPFLSTHPLASPRTPPQQAAQFPMHGCLRRSREMSVKCRLEDEDYHWSGEMGPHSSSLPPHCSWQLGVSVISVPVPLNHTQDVPLLLLTRTGISYQPFYQERSSNKPSLVPIDSVFYVIAAVEFTLITYYSFYPIFKDYLSTLCNTGLHNNI